MLAIPFTTHGQLGDKYQNIIEFLVPTFEERNKIKNITIVRYYRLSVQESYCSAIA